MRVSQSERTIDRHFTWINTGNLLDPLWQHMCLHENHSSVETAAGAELAPKLLLSSFSKNLFGAWSGFQKQVVQTKRANTAIPDAIPASHFSVRKHCWA